MEDTVDGRRRGHGVGEDVLPLGDEQVRGYAQQPTFVAGLYAFSSGVSKGLYEWVV